MTCSWFAVVINALFVTFGRGVGWAFAWFDAIPITSARKTFGFTTMHLIHALAVAEV